VGGRRKKEKGIQGDIVFLLIIVLQFLWIGCGGYILISNLVSAKWQIRQFLFMPVFYGLNGLKKVYL
jgi:hypothetical protein